MKPLLICLAIGLALYSSGVKAEPLYVAEAGDGVVVTLYSEPCKLEAVSNLPRRAVWTDKNKTYEGCWGARPDVGVIVLYFTDKAIGLAPMQAFRRVSNI